MVRVPELVTGEPLIGNMELLGPENATDVTVPAPAVGLHAGNPANTDKTSPLLPMLSLDSTLLADA
jgi:hypothetical protein